MIKAYRKTYKKETIIAKDFNFKAESNGYAVNVSYKEYIPCYQPLFSIGVDRLTQIIEVLKALQTEINQTGGE